MFQAVRPQLLLRCIALAALPLLAACEATVGLSGRDAEWARLQSDGFYVVRASHKGAIIAARGQQVAIEPATGFCLAEDSIETSDRSAFMLIGDCAVDGPPSGKRGYRGELQLPKAIPGIITVSISGDPGFRSADGSYDRLREVLKSPEGKAMLGRSGSGDGVAIKESREMDGALLLHLEDRSTELVPILSNQFWRAFVELNGRLTVVTISGFRDRPLGRERMLAYLISQVQTLGAANAVPLGPPETRVARAETGTRPAADVRTGGTRKLSDVRAEAAADGTVTIVPTVKDADAVAETKTDPVSPTKIAAAPDERRPTSTETAITRGNSRLERKMRIPAARPGSGATPVIAERPIAVASPDVRSGPVVGAIAPSAADTATSVPVTRPASGVTVPTILTTPAADLTRAAPSTDGGPATKNAPRTAPMAPKRRR